MQSIEQLERVKAALKRAIPEADNYIASHEEWKLIYSANSEEELNSRIIAIFELGKDIHARH